MNQVTRKMKVLEEVFRKPIWLSQMLKKIKIFSFEVEGDGLRPILGFFFSFLYFFFFKKKKLSF
jgi:hypothetical protein